MRRGVGVVVVVVAGELITISRIDGHQVICLLFSPFSTSLSLSPPLPTEESTTLSGRETGASLSPSRHHQKVIKMVKYYYINGSKDEVELEGGERVER